MKNKSRKKDLKTEVKAAEENAVNSAAENTANTVTENATDTFEAQSSKHKKHRKRKIEKILNTENPNAVPFSVVEAYKNIRLQLTTALSKTGGKTVAISSPNASEGKSTTAVNIAITLSQLNKKVLIIDADIRRGTVHQKLKIENDKGCLDVLSGAAKLEEAIKNHTPYLDIMTCGVALSNSCELFDSPAFDSMLQQLSEKYDYIIVDTPPLNLVSDALVISKKCDGLLYVIRSSVTTYEAFRKSLNSTERLGVNLVGVVINAINSQSGKYYKSKYGKYGKYGYYNKYGYYDNNAYY